MVYVLGATPAYTLLQYKCRSEKNNGCLLFAEYTSLSCTLPVIYCPWSGVSSSRLRVHERWWFFFSTAGRRCQPRRKAPPLTCNSLSWKRVTCNHWSDWNVKLSKENALAHLACAFSMVECAWQTIKGVFGVSSWKAYYYILQNSTCHNVTKTYNVKIN